LFCLRRCAYTVELILEAREKERKKKISNLAFQTNKPPSMEADILLWNVCAVDVDPSIYINKSSPLFFSIQTQSIDPQVERAASESTQLQLSPGS
jgi:hypothetical protein